MPRIADTARGQQRAGRKTELQAALQEVTGETRQRGVTRIAEPRITAYGECSDRDPNRTPRFKTTGPQGFVL